jgi:hypothetical protein
MPHDMYAIFASRGRLGGSHRCLGAHRIRPLRAAKISVSLGARKQHSTLLVLRRHYPAPTPTDIDLSPLIANEFL